jgi:hypothetical protein
MEYLYLAGPMRGHKDQNVPVFHEATKKLRAAGFIVFNPAERDEAVYGKGILSSDTGDPKEAEKKGFSLREALAADMEWICLTATMICMLPGWEKSRGATAEKAVAEALGLKVVYYGAAQPSEASHPYDESDGEALFV